VRAGGGETWHTASPVTNQCVGLRIRNNAVVMGIPPRALRILLLEYMGDSISDENGMQRRSAFVQNDEHCTAFGMEKISRVSRSSKFSPSFYSPIGRGRIDLPHTVPHGSCPPCFDDASSICENDRAFIRAKSVVRGPSPGQRESPEGIAPAPNQSRG
jgi:hypothetical protein